MSKPFPLRDGVRREFQKHQAEADAAYRQLGEPAAPPPLDGEWLPHYRKRLLQPLQQHSPDWKGAELPSDERVLNIAQKQILEAARHEAVAPTNIPPGQLVERRTRDESGRMISRFYGDPAAWMDQFAGERKRVVGWRTEK